VSEPTPLIPIIDARGLACPQPVLLARAGLAQQKPGERIQLLATDPMSRVDLAAFCARRGHTLVTVTGAATGWCFEIERGPRG